MTGILKEALGCFFKSAVRGFQKATTDSEACQNREPTVVSCIEMFQVQPQATGSVKFSSPSTSWSKVSAVQTTHAQSLSSERRFQLPIKIGRKYIPPLTLLIASLVGTAYAVTTIFTQTFPAIP
jgi:hypothetical protein